MTSKLKQERINKGLCPDCGEQAAPYYLCDRCRYINMVRRVCEKGVKAGTFRCKKKGRHKLYGIADPTIDFDYREAAPLDKRLAPRINGIPVDVKEDIYTILYRAGKPLTEEEIRYAWGKLRLRKGRTSAAHDMATILKAKEKRERRKQKWANREAIPPTAPGSPTAARS
jgi:hypothetical protein